ncbi:Hypothetical predicted protein [Xyrichtys novacula]|uniref:Uncharacterized protein n=1 Tax=Xyrichtys novacula TaxID=13765 RepID=A0AAV1G131_XYRNO|nr:Hypothetical predicted protein [Xyrichtys novacula]
MTYGFLLLFQNKTHMKFVHGYVDGTNILDLITWSVLISLALNSIGGQGENLVNTLSAINESTKSFFSLILCVQPSIQTNNTTCKTTNILSIKKQRSYEYIWTSEGKSM